MCFQMTLNDAQVFERKYSWRTGPLLDILFLSLSLSPPFHPSIFPLPGFRKECQVVTKLPGHPESPLVAADFRSSPWKPHTVAGPCPPLSSQSIILWTINRSRTLNPSLWFTTSLFLTGWAWPLTPWEDSSISILWQQSQQRKTHGSLFPIVTLASLVP